MPSHHKRRIKSVVAMAAELSLAIPQVVAHRIMRMAIAGPSLSERDRKEFQRMGTEKTSAFIESWNAITMQVLRANKALAVSSLRSFWSPLTKGRPSTNEAAAKLYSSALSVLSKGMAPVHRTALANAKRLARTRLL
jgi:hypothetical protein